MGMFDTIMGEIECPACRQTKEREIQTKRGPCLMETYYVGDTIEPFFFGDYWFEEEWYCADCLKRATEEDENSKMDWHKVYIHCINGLIVAISNARREEEKLPDWTLIHRISKDRHNYRSLLFKIDGMISNFKRRKEGEAPFPFDIGPKTTDELFERIQEDIAEVLKGESPGFF
jgi:hypothetical protein